MFWQAAVNKTGSLAISTDKVISNSSVKRKIPTQYLYVAFTWQ
jgi:hypothetical protein